MFMIYGPLQLAPQFIFMQLMFYSWFCGCDLNMDI